jgi:hypothetical protein
VDVYKLVEGRTGKESIRAREGGKGNYGIRELDECRVMVVVLVSSLIDYNFEYFIRTNNTFVNKLSMGCRFVI